LEATTIYFSIIIPTFNRGDLISQTITSILKQQNIPLEIIVVDDGGQDNTLQVIEGLNDKRIRYIKTENRERGAARNAGLKISTGMYVNYFDSDDIFGECLFDLREFITNNKFPNVIYGLIENVSEDGQSIEVIHPAYSSFRKALIYNNFLACGSVFIKRDIAIQNSFSEDRRLSGTEDWELWLRLYAIHDFVEFSRVVFKQRQHALRSLHKVPTSRVTERENTFVELIKKHQKTLSNKFSKDEIDLLISDRYTLIALAHSESISKKQGFNFLLKALKSSVSVIKRKRFWAVLKKLILD